MRNLTLVFLFLIIGLSFSVSVDIKFFYIPGLDVNEEINATLDKVSKQYEGLIDIERIPFMIKTFGGFYDKNPKAIAYDIHKTPAVVINDQLIFEGYRVDHEELIVDAIENLLKDFRTEIEKSLDEVYDRLEKVEKKIEESDVEYKTELQRKLLKAKLNYISAKEAYKRKDYLKAKQDLEIADMWLGEVNSSIVTRKIVTVEKIDELKVDAEKELENAEKKLKNTNKTLFLMQKRGYDIFLALQILKNARNNLNSAKSFYVSQDYEKSISSSIQAQILCDSAIQSVKLKVVPPSQPKIPAWVYPIPLFLILLGALLYQLRSKRTAAKYKKEKEVPPENAVPRVMVIERPEPSSVESDVESEIEEVSEEPTQLEPEPKPEIIEEAELEKIDAEKIEEIATKWMNERGMIDGRLIAWGSKVDEFWFVVAHQGKIHRVTIDKHGKVVDWDLKS
ncbi:MAG: hypothetical protein ACE5K4_05015 [Candidatus Hydrothermarchaeota archaeon]